MSNNDSKLSPAFVAQQQKRLEALRDQILRDTSAAADEQRELGQRHNEVQDSGDEGAIEASRHAADALSAGGQRRLPEIRRALEKIDEGSYGLSDDSGEPIGRARLEAVPEACFTVDEEELRERYDTGDTGGAPAD